MSESARGNGATASPEASTVTIVTQTRVQPGQAEAFTRCQQDVSQSVAQCPGFLKQTVIPPSPPAQVDWVILQRFENTEAAVAWLNSERRLALLEGALPLLMGHDDIHIVKDGGSGVLPSPVSVVISTRIKPGNEDAYRAWEQRIAAAQTKSAGFQGYRLEPPVPNVQTDWLSILRFDSEANLQGWLNSPARLKLLKEAEAFTEEFHARIVRTGFDQWFAAATSSQPAPPAWKQNMLVLLMLYPVVFLFGIFVQKPWLIDKAGLPFWLALFIGNTVSVAMLNWLVPWTSRRFDWWLRYGSHHSKMTDLAGAGLVIGLYALCLFAFSRFP
jgi:hypothetical protein